MEGHASSVPGGTLTAPARGGSETTLYAAYALDVADTSVGMGRANHAGIGHPGQLEIVDKVSMSGKKSLILHAADRASYSRVAHPVSRRCLCCESAHLCRSVEC